MNKLSTQYLNLTLRSPLIVSSSPFSSNIENIKSAYKAGAGAIVLKSIFEEQILSEALTTPDYNSYPDSLDYLHTYIKENQLSSYEELIKSSKQETDIPIIASINCSSQSHWQDFASRLCLAGADAIELNIFKLPNTKEESSSVLEKEFLNIIDSVKKVSELPLSIKLSSQFTNPINICKELYYRNIKSVVLFNRFYTPDINIETLKVSSGGVWSHSNELSNIIRWVGIIHKELPELHLSASTGVHHCEDAIKVMLSGASSVQLCSSIHQHGFSIITEMNQFITEWMERHQFSTLNEFIGKLSPRNINSTAYERVQFMKYFASTK